MPLGALRLPEITPLPWLQARVLFSLVLLSIEGG